MNQQEAEKNKWRCQECETPLEVSRGGIYYCPSPTCVTNKKILAVLEDKKL